MYINEREKERKKHQQLINCEKTILNNKNFKTIDYYLKKKNFILFPKSLSFHIFILCRANGKYSTPTALSFARNLYKKNIIS